MDGATFDFMRPSRPSVLPPATRRTDPATSREAELAVNRTGARAGQQAEVFGLVKQRPGLTARELATHCALDRYQVQRRLSDLENGGLVKKGAARDCRAGGRKSHTWVAVRVDERNGD